MRKTNAEGLHSKRVYLPLERQDSGGNLSLLTAVSVFDTHYPEWDQSVWAAARNFIKRNRKKVRLVVLGGDNLHCESISHHSKGKGKYRTLGQMKRELDGFKREVLEPLERVVSNKCRLVWLTGNHEDWLEQMFEEQPELAGLIDFPTQLGLSERGWIIKRQGDHFKHGHLKWIHGDVLSGNHINKALNTYVENTMYGHFHTGASGTKVLPHSKQHKWQAWAIGCAGKLDSGYLKHRPTGWLNQIAITEFRERGLFNNYPVTLFDGQFVYGGARYGGQ
jgi:hypothetical protein